MFVTLAPMRSRAGILAFTRRLLASTRRRLGPALRPLGSTVRRAGSAARPGLGAAGRLLASTARPLASAARPLGSAGRRLASKGPRLGRVPLVPTLVLVAAVTALGMVAGSRGSSDSTPPGGPVLLAAAAAELVAETNTDGPRRGGEAYYRRTLRKHASAKEVTAFLPLYHEAERVFGVNWLLIASIHRQETAFSKSPTTYHGLNPFGCCAGPMQFNVTNGPVSTWKTYRNAFRKGRRPARYPHRTRKHPSIYDDFDAIMAAGKLLSDAGAGAGLDAGAWSAAFSYYGHDLFGVTYANTVLARAENWSRNGFCPDCEPDAGLVAEFEDSYGAEIRRQMTAEDRLQKKHKKKKKRKKGRDDESEPDERRREREEAKERALRRKLKRLPSGPRSKTREEAPKPAPRPRQRPTEAKPPPPPATPPPAAPQAPAQECAPLLKLLGCRKE